jgi:alpha-beta hydrolase superfamily lysophospholipase
MKQPPVAVEDRIRNADGMSLFIRSWRPEMPPRAVVAIVPGFNSHSGYYGWVAGQLVASGFAAYAIDLRGRGQSDGERFYVGKFSDYGVDVETLMALVKSREPGLPVFLLGHSAGGVVACVYALEHPHELAGLICESFAHELPAPDFALAVFKGVSHIFPHAHIVRLKNEQFSRDPEVVRAMDADPLIAHETQPTRTLAEMVRADERLKREYGQIVLPVLIMHGTADKATNPSGSQHFFDGAGSIDKTLKMYEGHYHDLLNDVGKEVVMHDVLGWIAARAPMRAGV